MSDKSYYVNYRSPGARSELRFYLNLHDFRTGIGVDIVPLSRYLRTGIHLITRHFNQCPATRKIRLTLFSWRSGL